MGKNPEEEVAGETRLLWDKAHEKLPSTIGVDEHLSMFVNFTGSQLSPGESVLDAGCGRGRHLSLIEEMGYSVWGFDLSEIAASQARKTQSDAVIRDRILVADLRSLPCRDGSYSAAVCVHTLPYNRQSDIEMIVSELDRVLSPGGWLYADLLDLTDVEYGNGEEIEKHTFRDAGGLAVHFSGEKEIRVLLSRFNITRLEKIMVGTKPRFRTAWAVWAQRS